MIRSIITSQIGDALRAKDELKLTTLRMLSSALNYEFIAKQHELSQEDEFVVVRREVKKRQDAINAYEMAKGKLTGHTEEDLSEKIEKEKKEIEILNVYLPAEISDQELDNIIRMVIKDTAAAGIKDMGKVIGIVKEKTKGTAGGQRISEAVKLKLE